MMNFTAKDTKHRLRKGLQATIYDTAAPEDSFEYNTIIFKRKAIFTNFSKIVTFHNFYENRLKI